MADASHSLDLDGLGGAGSWLVDADTALVTCSPAMLAVVGVPDQAPAPRLADLFVHATEQDRLRVVQAVQSAVLVSGSMEEDVCLHLPGGSRWVRVRGRVSTTNAGQLIGTCQDISVEKRRERVLAERASRDPLTGLPNKTIFAERLRESIAAISSDSVGVLLVDLDRFKDINDRYGAEVGDTLLARVGDRLARVVRPGDVVARFGGDEFGVLCERLQDEEAVHRVATRVLDAIATPLTLGTDRVVVTASVGLVQVSEPNADAQTVLREADAAMYEAKQAGRARVETFDHAARTRRATHRRIAEEISDALERREFELWYQPVVSLETWEPTGVEALLRWRHPERGVVGAGEIIPVAEADGSIVRLGAWVLEEACALAAAESRPMAVNVSAKQLSARDFLPTVRAVLADSRLAPSLLCLEITETVLMDDIDASIAVLTQVRDLGVRIAVDDFGIGYSSLSYLRRLPIDIVKIDRSFTCELGDPGCNAIVAAISNLSRALGLTVVAEGIEARKQLITLRALRCDQAQGYLLSWPLTLDELHAWDPLQWRAGAPSTSIDVREVIGRRAARLRQRTGRSINLQVPSAMPPLAADPETLSTVVDELLVNALAFSPPDTPAVVRVTSDRRWVRVSVADFGVGMTDHDAARCWEQFFQGSRPPLSGGRGTGIGLYVVRSLIEGLGGFTNVRTSPRGGSTFTFALPRERRPDRAGVGEASSIQEVMKQVGVNRRRTR